MQSHRNRLDDVSCSYLYRSKPSKEGLPVNSVLDAALCSVIE